MKRWQNEMLSRNLLARWLMSGDWTGKITAREGLTEQLLATMGAQLTLHETRAHKWNQKEDNTSGREKENWATKIEDTEHRPDRRQ
jgi:hypothetical protein